MISFWLLVDFSGKKREQFIYFSFFIKNWKKKLIHILQVYTQPLTSFKYLNQISRSSYYFLNTTAFSVKFWLKMQKWAKCSIFKQPKI